MRIREIIIILIALLAMTAAVYSWYHPREIERVKMTYQDRTKTVFVKVPVKIEGGTVQGTGEVVQNDPVIATADCPASKTGSEVVTTITPSTGEAHIFVRPKELKLFGFEDAKELGLRYGFKSEIDIFGRWTFLRVGSLYGALYSEASIQQDRSGGNIMFEVSYRW